MPTDLKPAEQDPAYLNDAHVLICEALADGGDPDDHYDAASAVLDALAAAGWHLLNAEDAAKLLGAYVLQEVRMGLKIGVVICGEREAQCECVLPKDHKGLHACDEGCGGSWGWDEEGRFIIGSFPSKVFGAGRRPRTPTAGQSGE